MARSVTTPPIRYEQSCQTPLAPLFQVTVEKWNMSIVESLKKRLFPLSILGWEFPKKTG